MADTVHTVALLTLAQNYRRDIVRQINRQSVALKLLPIVQGEGKNVAIATESSGIVAESYSEGADATNFGSDAQAPALLAWGQYRANFHVSGLARAASATSRTPEGNIEIWARNVANGASALASLLNGDLYVGNAANKIVGFGQAIGSLSNIYGGIDRSDSANAYWRPYVADPGVATALTFDLIRLDLDTIFEQCGMRPDIALVKPSVYRALGALFDPSRYYQVQTNVIPTRGSRGAVTLEGGIGAIAFEGCIFVEDKDATANAIHYINTMYTAIEYLPTDQEIPGTEDESMVVEADDGFGLVPLGMRLEMLGKTGDSDKAEMRCYVQLRVERPNSCGMRKNVQTS